jgi:flagella basal body P-ring formation protein FlgA
MKRRILFLFCWSACFAPAQVPVCHPVEGDRILAQDLAAVLPDFTSAPPQALIAQSPVPGAQRTFHVSELRALAHRFGVTLTSTDEPCFDWAMHPLNRNSAISAMQESLKVEGAKIEIADLISGSVPAGRLDFPLPNLGVPAATGPREPVLWRGDVIYGESHRFAIWARVNIAVPCQKLTAAESLKAGQPIDAHQIRVTTGSCFPSAATELSIEQVEGMTPVHAISARAELRLDLLTPPNDINRGDEVRVEVRSGAAHLVLTGRALSSGRSGETISIRNPENNRTFQARVTGKGAALVDAGASKGI